MGYYGICKECKKDTYLNDETGLCYSCLTIIENDHYHFEDEATGKPVRITTMELTTGDSYLILGTPGDVINEIYKTEKSWALIENKEEKAQLC